MRTASITVAAAVLAACSYERSGTTIETDGAVSVSEFQSESAKGVAVARLDCPQQQGQLRRVAADADGRRCEYRTDSGAEVELRLAEPSEMEALQAELTALLPGAAESGPDPTAAAAAYDEALAKYNAAMEAYDRATQAYDDLRSPGASTPVPPVPPVPPAPPAPPKPAAPAIAGGGSIRFVHHDTMAGPGWRSIGYRLRGPADGRRVLGLLRAREGGENRALMREVEALVDRNMRG